MGHGTIGGDPGIQFEAYSGSGRQYIIDDWVNPSWSSHYGQSGSGFGYLRFTLNRETGTDYPDIGYGYRVIVRKYLNTILFDGKITSVDEASSDRGDTITITCLGWQVASEDEEVFRYFCDTRSTRWHIDGGVPKGSYRPDIFSFGYNPTDLFLHSNANSVVTSGDYTEGVYEFSPDETAQRITMELSQVLGRGNPYPYWFSGTISAISGAVITYTDDFGEGTLGLYQQLANITKKSSAMVGSFDTVANTITVTNEDHVAGWQVGDEMFVASAYFFATISVVAGTTITYTGPQGEDLVSSTTGWVLYNATKVSLATVASWTPGSNQVDVTVAAEIATWVATDLIVIYTPFWVEILDSEDNSIWPGAEWRWGAIQNNHSSLDLTTTGSPSGFKVKFECYLSGVADDANFVSLFNVKVYSTTSACTTEMLAKYAVGILSGSGHGLDDSEDDIESISKLLEPAVFEFVTVGQMMSWACSFGDGSGNLVAWGVRLNDDRRFFLETQDTQTLVYKIGRDAPISVSTKGNVQDSMQSVRGVYTDERGEQQSTGFQYDEDSFLEGIYYRARSIRLDNVTDLDEANAMVALYLDENKNPKRSSSYSVSEGAVLTPGGLVVPIDEVKATGKIVAIEDWRAVEAGVSSTDIRDRWTQEQIVAVEINYDSKQAKLVPANALSQFDLYMKELARMKTA